MVFRKYQVSQSGLAWKHPVEEPVKQWDNISKKWPVRLDQHNVDDVNGLELIDLK